VSVLTVFDDKGWVLLADIELPASKTGAMVARVDTFLIIFCPVRVPYTRQPSA